MKFLHRFKYKLNIYYISKKISLVCAFSGFAYCVHQFLETHHKLNHILKTEVLELEKKRVEYIYIHDPNIQKIIESINKTTNYNYDIYEYISFNRMWDNFRKALAWRYLVLAESPDRDFRLRAVRCLSQMKNLKDCDYWQLAQVCDSRTAIGLARSSNVDLRLFLRSPLKANKEIIIRDLDNFFAKLDTKGHSCLNTFIQKVFNHYKKRNIFRDSSEMVYNPSFMIQNEIIPLSVEALFHHATIDENALDFIENDGLAVFMKIALLYKDDEMISIMLAKILSYMSITDSIIEPLFNTGWIGKLAAWAQSPDIRLSAPAQRTLANLDVDFRQSKFPRRVYQLHPVNRNFSDPKLDIIFIHGLLGGVFVTWRQRDRDDKSGITLMGATQRSGENIRKRWTSDEETQEFLEHLQEYHQGEWKDLGRDFEIVMPDCPEATLGPANGPFCLTQNDIPCMGYTQCWPRDWLPMDCSNIRVVGINYETNLSTWGKVCPYDGRQTLEKRSVELLSKLKEAGIGKRPIIWVAHSMGGLLVKGILTKAALSEDAYEQSLVSNTKALFFYSVPHQGSPLAALGSPTQIIVAPSLEVQELREGSPALAKLHKNFLEFLKNYPEIEMISFGETRSTTISTLRMEFNLVPLHSAKNSSGRTILNKRDVAESLSSHHGHCKNHHPQVSELAAKAAANAHTASESQESVAKNFASLAGEMVKNDMAEKAAMEAKMAQLAFAAKEELVEQVSNELKAQENLLKQESSIKDEIDQEAQIAQQEAQEAVNELKAIKAVERLAEKHVATAQEEAQSIIKQQSEVAELEQETIRREQELAAELNRERCDLEKTRKAASAATAAAQRAKQNTSGGGTGPELVNANLNAPPGNNNNEIGEPMMYGRKRRRIRRRSRKRIGANG